MTVYHKIMVRKKVFGLSYLRRQHANANKFDANANKFGATFVLKFTRK